MNEETPGTREGLTGPAPDETTPDRPEPAAARLDADAAIAESPAGGDGEISPPIGARSRQSLPRWLPAFALAAIAATIVGIVVYVLAGGDGGSAGSAAGILDGFIHQSSPTDAVESFSGKLPSDFPQDFPIYKGSSVVASFTIGTDQGTLHYVVLSTSGQPQQIYDYYLKNLDSDPWQVEAARSSDELTALAFSRPDNADIEGQVSAFHSNLDNRTAIYISYQDTSKTGASPSEPFTLGQSRPLPPGFPSDIPIYKGKKGDSVVFDTIFQRGGGNLSFLVSFLTRDSQDDVVNYYRQEFQKRGWTVTDSQAQANSFNLGIDFNDGTKKEISGTISADAFAPDPSLVRVDMQLQVSSSRGRGN